ncbi:ExeA3: general secretion pathway protein A [Desulfosarcina variabilis str. Montpellier]|uniref:AAA family ATPase n=1 Tax=Desulfosarcina variabilis TaxID=2300 RepID=UPI003AFAB4B3
MYLDFYQLSIKPFQISTDHRFLWLGEKHQEALAVLKYGIMDNKGFLLLTGDVGTGKTTLLNALVNSLGDDVLVAMVADPGLGKMDFFNFVADSFGMNKNFKSKGEFLIYLKNYLISLNKHRKQALLIIDECQHLTQKLLEEIRLLSNIEKADLKLINIFFVGQSEFNNIILRPQNRAIRQRITINYNITALSEAETNAYIRYRLSIAGSEEAIFTADAIREIYKFSNGYPRLINIVCDQALLTGFVRERKLIDRQIIAECSNELRIEQGISIEHSDATPEARAEINQQSVPQKEVVQKYKPLAAIQNHLEMKTPLAMALIIILIIWIGLITIYLFSQNRSDMSARGMNNRSAVAEAEMKNGLQDIDSGADNILFASQSPDDKDEPPFVNASAIENQQLEPEGAKEPGAKKDREAVGEKQVPSDADQISLSDIKDRYGVFPEVHFGVNSNKLSDDGYEILAKIAQFCIQNPETILILRGYTDLSGVRAYNMKLSEFRADVVKTYLVGRGVKPDAITTIAVGPDDKGPGGTTVSYEGDRRKVMIEIITPTG